MDTEPEKTEMEGYSRENGLMEPQPDRAWVTHAGSPGEVFMMSGKQQTPAMRKSFRSGYYWCIRERSSARVFFKRVAVLTLVGF